jgi:hypothetical protein
MFPIHRWGTTMPKRSCQPKIELTATGYIKATCIPGIIESLTNDQEVWTYAEFTMNYVPGVFDVLTNGNVSVSWKRGNENNWSWSKMALSFKRANLWFTRDAHKRAVFEAAKPVMAAKRELAEHAAHLESLGNRAEGVERIWEERMQSKASRKQSKPKLQP